MMQRILFLVVVFFAAMFPAIAQKVDVDNIRFEVTDVERVPEGDKKPGYLVVKYQLTNHDDRRKLSVDQQLQYRVMDEFGNEYRRLANIPVEGGISERILPNSFPSIYPGETYGETLFFEKPVARANQLTFFINAQPFGVQTTVQIPLKLTPDVANSVQIINPLEGAVLEQGEVVHLNIRITGGIAPKRLIVLAFGQTFSDDNPALENVYDINIPTDQALGPEIINVIAQWRPEHDSITRSAYINVTIKDALPLDVL